jgi:cytochrome c oxidase cbb3-type subunit 1
MASIAAKHRPEFDDSIVKLFVIMSLVWTFLGLSAGVFIALEMVFPDLSNGIPYLNFGRFRPVHTTSVILGLGGNVLFATSLFVVQRTCQARLAGGKLIYLVFWAFQVFMFAAVGSYILGYTQGKEYAEPEWHLDILLTVIWLIYAYVYIVTIMRRQEPHIYVANWFFLAFILVVALLHIGNGLAIPISWMSPKSVPLFGGVQSAMIQWWYGHNMVGFWLTTGFLGIMYYYVPKRAARPVYSYRLSILHFWALVFLYIWAGAHHLHYTALPDWTQALGMTMSLMLWAPSWGGMFNGILTLSGAWHKLVEDPVLRFLVIAVAFYGMSTFEGPLMSIKSVNALSHYTEWTISHVHSGALGWVALISFGALYHTIPVIWKRPEMYSIRMISWHLWLACIGIVLYITSMWVAGISQGLMWRSYDEMGFLSYSFVEIMAALAPYYAIRAAGGVFFLCGAILMIINTILTVWSKPQEISEAVPLGSMAAVASAR